MEPPQPAKLDPVWWGDKLDKKNCVDAYSSTYSMTETEAASPQDLSESFLGDIIIDDTSPPENDAAAPSETNGKGNKKGKKSDRTREPKDQVPIEELYDLSKPIKRVSELIQK